MRRIVLFVSLLFALSQSVFAQRSGLLVSGADVRPGGWISSHHAGDSFRAFFKVQGGRVARYDYYYQLRVVNQMKPTFSNCRRFDSPSVLRELFGTKDMRTLLVSVGIRYRVTNDVDSIFQNRQVPLVFVGHNKDSGGSARRGCFFEPTESTSMILSRYNGAGVTDTNEDFIVNVTAQRGEEVEYSFVKRLKELFVTFNTAFSWTQIASGKVDAFAKAATDFETAINAAGDSFKKYSEEFTVETVSGSAGRLYVTIPDFVERSAGGIVIFSRLTSSLLIDTRPDAVQTFETATILPNHGLMTRECAKDIIEKKACTKPSRTVHEMLANYLSGDDPALFDLHTAEGRKKLFKTCQKLRFFTTNKLELSTIDALLVRWAALKSFKVQDRLAEATERQKLALENGIPETDLVAECWTPDDDRKLGLFLTEMNYKL